MIVFYHNHKWLDHYTNCFFSFFKFMTIVTILPMIYISCKQQISESCFSTEVRQINPASDISSDMFYA